MIADHIAPGPLVTRFVLMVTALVLVALVAVAFAMQSSLLRMSGSDGEIPVPTSDGLTIPVYPGAKRVESGSPDTYSFTSADAPLDIFTYYGAHLHERGWITEEQFDRLVRYSWRAGPTAQYQVVADLDAYGEAGPSTDRTRFSIRIGLQPNPNGVPVYKSIGQPTVRDMWATEESDGPGVIIDIPQRQLTYLTGETPEAAYDFYREKLPTYGWRLISDNRDSDGGLTFGFSQYRSVSRGVRGAQVNVIARPTGKGPVEVTIQVRSQSMLENWDPEPIPTFTPVSMP
jgi:hypothetical protein